ncbi:hypothetical protein [Tenacibaculum sp. Ill]|uniref:hypothetical protein n=1 Tax=Tenacibaculum sp. Ill TaxID=3445935 RepID=UPI003F78B8C7
MYKNIKHINLFILTFALVLLSFGANAQEVRVIDNKGTIQTVNNNTVTTSTTAPTNPVENDVWFDTTNSQIKIYDTVNGWKLITSTLASQNIYTADGTLTGNRTLDGDAHNLVFGNINFFQLFSNFDLQIATIGGNMQLSAARTMQITAHENIILQSPTEFNSTLLDVNNLAGTSGQVLTSTVTGVQWANSQQNTVTVSTDTDTIQNEPDGTFPASPIENDTFIYRPTNGEKVYYVFDGTEWNMIAPTKAARVFYPPSIAIDASTTGTNFTKNLYQEYSDQFSLAVPTTSASSTGAPSSIPTYASNQLYYYVTYYDPTIFNNVSIDANGNMTYDIINTPTDDNTIINVVFVVK